MRSALASVAVRIVAAGLALAPRADLYAQPLGGMGIRVLDASIAELVSLVESAVLSGRPESVVAEAEELRSRIALAANDPANFRGFIALANWHRERLAAPGESTSDRMRQSRRWLDRAIEVARSNRERTEAHELRSYVAAFLGDFTVAESDLELVSAAYSQAGDRESAARCLRRRAFLEFRRGHPELIDPLLDQRSRELAEILGHDPPLDNTDEYLRILANLRLGNLDRAAAAADRHGRAERALLRDAPYPVIRWSYRRSQFNLAVLAGCALEHARSHPADEARIFAMLAGFMEGARVRALRAALGGFESRPEGFTLEDLRPLSSKIVVLRYLVASDAQGEGRRLIVLASRGEERRVLELGDADEIDRACDAFMDRWLGKSSLTASAHEYAAAARDLSHRVLGPVQDWLAAEESARLLIVAEGALTRLPFQSLVISQPEARAESYARLDYLVRHAAILHLPSFGVVDALAKPTDEDSCLALLAPERAGEAPLHFAGLEERSIAASHPRTTVLSGRAASKAALLERLGRDPPGWLHLACHARSDTNAEQRAVLELARERTDSAADSELTVTDVAQLPLRRGTRVVLSACGTANGDYMRGEGVLGLWRAFLAAGASCVVSTLKDVDDRSIATWSGRFHAAAATGSPLAEAARQADLAWLDGTARPRFPRGMGIVDPAHPALWAVTLCVGDDGGAIPGRER